MYCNHHLEMTQFGYILAPPGSVKQLTHLDSIFASVNSLFVIPNFRLYPSSNVRSASTTNSTEFVDLPKHDQHYSSIFDVRDKEDLFSRMDSVEAWSPGAEFVVRKDCQQYDFWQFFSNTMHRGGGNGGGNIQRLICFVVFSPASHSLHYGDEDPVMAPEMLLKFHENGSANAASYLADWVEKSNLDTVLFNYKQGAVGNGQLRPLGKLIRKLAEDTLEEREERSIEAVTSTSVRPGTRSSQIQLRRRTKK